MRLYYNLKLKKYSRELRSSMTDAERLLWSKLRQKQINGLQFYRQRIIGEYIVDFYCPKAKLIIELDGSQHYTEKGLRSDRIRDKNLNSKELCVMRFSDRDIFENIDEIMERIFVAVIPFNLPLEKGGN